MNPAAFDALAELLRLRASRSREAARLVLVDGMSQSDAARAVGVSRAGVNNVVATCRRGLDLAQRATQSCGTIGRKAPA